MNKKFFTLVLGVLLSFAAFTANAQVAWLGTTNWGATGAGALAAIDEATEIPESCGRFIIGDPTGAFVLVMKPSTTIPSGYSVEWDAYNTANVFESIWEVIPVGFKYGGMQFQFINVAHGMAMTYDSATKTIGVDGDQLDFSWFSGTTNLQTGTGEGPKDIYVRVGDGEFRVLDFITAGTPAAGLVTTDTRDNTTGAKGLNKVAGTKLELFTPKPFVVDDTMLNTLNPATPASGFAPGWFELSFDGEPLSIYGTAVEKNIWTSGPLYANPGTALGRVKIQKRKPTPTAVQAAQPYIYNAKEYHNASGIGLLKFAYGEKGFRSDLTTINTGLAVANPNKITIAAAPAAPTTIPYLDNAATPGKFSFVDAAGAVIPHNQLATKFAAGDACLVATVKALRNIYNNYSEFDDEAAVSAGTDQFLTAYTAADLPMYEFLKSVGLQQILYTVSEEDRREYTFTYFPGANQFTIQAAVATGVAGFDNVATSGMLRNAEDWDLAMIDPAGNGFGKIPAAVANAALLMAGPTAGNAYVGMRDLVVGKHSEVTIINEPAMTYATLKNLGTKISATAVGSCSSAIEFEKLEEGVYMVEQFVGGAYKQVLIPIYHDATFPSTTAPAPVVAITKENKQDYNQMPAAHWVVKKVTTSTNPRYSVRNREFGTNLWGPNPTLWFVKDNQGRYYPFGSAGAHYRFTKITDEKILNDKYLGHFFIDEERAQFDTYAFNYLNELADDAYMNVTGVGNDSTMFVKRGEKTWFRFIPQDTDPSTFGDQLEEPYGLQGGAIKDADGEFMCAPLVRSHYQIQVNDPSKKFVDNRYMKEQVDGSTIKYSVQTAPLIPARFILKLENTVNGVNYYAFKQLNWAVPGPGGTIVPLALPWNQNKVGVQDATLGLRQELMTEVRTSAFHPLLMDDPLYRRFNRSGEFGENGKGDKPDTLIFFDINNPNRVLFEDANSVYALNDPNGVLEGGANKAEDKRLSILDQINYLGLHSVAEVEKNNAIYVDTAFVDRNNAQQLIIKGQKELAKPQYLLVVNPYIKYPEDQGCGVVSDGFVRGRYLIATWMSYNTGTGTPTRRGANYLYRTDANPKGLITNANHVLWNRDYQRLIFVDAIHLEDFLYVNYGNAAIDNAKISKAYLDGFVGTKYGVYRVNLANNLHKPEVFQFRLIDETAPRDKAQNFMIESFETDLRTVAPFAGGWLKNQNGVPVLTEDGGSFGNAMQNGLPLNVRVTSEDPVANEAIATTEFRVVAENGALNILNAAGKRVVVSNILGQTVVNTVLASDNATVEVPAGIVVVAVEGEAAVKAIVR